MCFASVSAELPAELLCDFTVQITAVVSAHNDQSRPYNLTAIVASLNSPMDFSMYIQNFTHQVSRSVHPCPCYSVIFRLHILAAWHTLLQHKCPKCHEIDEHWCALAKNSVLVYASSNETPSLCRICGCINDHCLGVCFSFGRDARICWKVTVLTRPVTTAT